MDLVVDVIVVASATLSVSIFFLLAFGVFQLQSVLALATKFIYAAEFKILNNIARVLK